MAVQKMKLVGIIGNIKKLDETVAQCIRSCFFQPENATEYLIGKKGFTKIVDESPAASLLAALNGIYMSLNHEPAFRKADEVKCTLEDADSLIKLINNEIESIVNRRREITDTLSSYKKSIESLAHFKDVDINLNELFNRKFIKVRFVKIPLESYERLQQYTSDSLMFVPTAADDTSYWGLYITTKDASEKNDKLLASLFNEKFDIPENAGTAEQTSALIASDFENLEEELSTLDERMNSIFKMYKEQLTDAYAVVYKQAKISEVKKYAATYGKSFMIVGWVPTKYQHWFASEMESVKGIEITYDDPDPASEFAPPTTIKNIKLFRPFQYLVDMYGKPNYHEVDPTPFIGIIYTLLFGIMFADVGQGILLGLIGYFYMYKKRDNLMGRVLLPCGFCSGIFGFLFGSIFGYEYSGNNWVTKFYNAINFEPPVKVLEQAAWLLKESIFIGITLVVIAMVINIYSKCKQKKYGLALFGNNGLCGIVFYISGVLLIMDEVFKMHPFGININAALTGIFGMILPLILIFLEPVLGAMIEGRKREKEKIGDYILENFFELFEVVLSYLSNTLSFLRVGAFVLIHAGMMKTFISIAVLFGPTGQVVTMIVGNIFVMCLEGLLVGIQVLRLSFYEMFSRFYDGDGDDFKPVRINANAFAKYKKSL